MIYPLDLIAIVDKKADIASDKNIKDNYLLRFMLKDIFLFAEHQEKAFFGLGYKLTLTRTKNDAVIDKDADISDARFKIDQIHWFVPHYIPSFQQQGILSKQFFN